MSGPEHVWTMTSQNGAQCEWSCSVHPGEHKTTFDGKGAPITVPRSAVGDNPADTRSVILEGRVSSCYCTRPAHNGQPCPTPTEPTYSVCQDCYQGRCQSGRVSSPRVPGHGLLHEGRPVLAEACCAMNVTTHGLRNQYDQQGHGICACGAMSPHEDTTAARQRWHREHKAKVAAHA